MCGIAGAAIYDPNVARLDGLLAVVEASASRGEDAFGVVRWSRSAGFSRVACHGRVERDWLTRLGAPTPDEVTFYIHTSRAEPTTEWRDKRTDADIPPFVDHGIAVAHNGIIANDETLVRRFEVERPSHVDTAILPALVARLGIWTAIAELRGGAALAIVKARSAKLVLCRNFMPLVVGWEPGIVSFASETAFFPGAGRPFRSRQLWELPPFTGVEISAHGYRGPFEWGQVVDAADDAAWSPFPALQWRTNE
jgi:7-cyano-7-deazaguanine synthase